MKMKNFLKEEPKKETRKNEREEDKHEVDILEQESMGIRDSSKRERKEKKRRMEEMKVRRRRNEEEIKRNYRNHLPVNLRLMREARVKNLNDILHHLLQNPPIQGETSYVSD